jgi:hypothetical protein
MALLPLEAGAVKLTVAVPAVVPAATLTAFGAPGGVVTVSAVEPVTVPDVAVIVVDPGATAVAIPVVAIVAIDVLEEFQVTDDVRFWVELSEYVPVAVYCCVAFTAMLILAGVTIMDTRAGVATVSAVEPVTVPDVAVIVVDPGATAVAIPVDAIVAIDVLEELQTTEDVRFWVELSEYVPVAMYC